jgi:hypothetical protein
MYSEKRPDYTTFSDTKIDKKELYQQDLVAMNK